MLRSSAPVYYRVSTNVHNSSHQDQRQNPVLTTHPDIAASTKVGFFAPATGRSAAGSDAMPPGKAAAGHCPAPDHVTWQIRRNLRQLRRDRIDGGSNGEDAVSASPAAPEPTAASTGAHSRTDTASGSSSTSSTTDSRSS